MIPTPSRTDRLRDLRARTAIVGAHPDDEAIGVGARLPLFEDVWLIHVTDGAPANGGDATAHGFRTIGEYAEARRRELADALDLAGIPEDRAVCLNCPDQKASYHIADAARRVANLIRSLGVERIITHPYEGGHPDHDATACAVHAACELIRSERVMLPNWSR